MDLAAQAYKQAGLNSVWECNSLWVQALRIVREYKACRSVYPYWAFEPVQSSVYPNLDRADNGPDRA